MKLDQGMNCIKMERCMNHRTLATKKEGTENGRGYLKCGGLNENVPHRLLEIGTIGSCGLVGVGVALLEEVCHWGWALGFQKPKPGALSLSLLSASPAVCQSRCRHLSYLSSTRSACILPCFLP